MILSLSFKKILMLPSCRQRLCLTRDRFVYWPSLALWLSLSSLTVMTSHPPLLPRSRLKPRREHEETILVRKGCEEAIGLLSWRDYTIFVGPCWTSNSHCRCWLRSCRATLLVLLLPWGYRGSLCLHHWVDPTNGRDRWGNDVTRS